MANELQHYRSCVNCDGKAEDHMEYAPHNMTEWSEWTETSGGYDYDPATQTLWVQVRNCKDCDYKDCQYKLMAKDITRTLTIYYRLFNENGEVAGDAGQVAKPCIRSCKAGEEYDVKSPDAPAGYRVESGKDYVKGIMPDNDAQITVKYEPITYTWTIRYVDEAGNPVASPFVKEFTAADIGTLSPPANPAVKHYSVASTTVSAPAALESKTDQVVYKADAYKLTIVYHYSDGSAEDSEVTHEHKVGDNYSYDTPAVEGYTFDVEKVDGVMGSGDVKVTVTYTPVELSLIHI